jgi:tetratricopeptide (TPR) repeat protein/predicted Ser/Thr protein kinase
MLGKTISHYRILSKLGEGGMGVVYKAEDLTLGRTVALKFLPPDSIAREEDRARLVHEARAAAALLHPNICPVYEIAEADSRIFIAMAHIEGRSLKDRIAEGPIPLEEALSIARQIGDALASAHAKGIIHRDIKPANVMLTADGRPMLMDFGLAKVSGATKLTRTGTTMGTVAYMSPEQVQGREADHRADIWALGAVLYEMVSGRPPFGGDYEAALLYSILNEDPEPLAEEGGDISAGLDGIVAKALAKDPARRYQKAEDLVADLDALARDSGALPAGKVMPARGLKRLWRRARPRQRAAAVASVVALVAIASILIIRSGLMRPASEQYFLAVMDFHDATSGGDSTLAAAITELVNTNLVQSLIDTEGIRVKSLDLLHDLRRRLYGQRRGAIDRSQIYDLARQAETTLYLVGTIGQAGPNQFVDWELVDARNGNVVGGSRAEGAKLSVIADKIIEDVLPRIARACGIEPASAASSVESITTKNPRAYQHYTAGMLASEEGRVDDAIAEFERAVALDSTFALAYLELGREYLHYFAGQKVHECFDKAWSLKSHLGIKDQLRLEAERENYGSGTIGRSIAILRTMRERWPDDRQILIDLRYRVGSRWYFREAIEISEEGLRMYPDDRAIGGLAYCGLLAVVGRIDEALRYARSYAKRHPGEPMGWNDLGWVYLYSGLPDSAEVAFNKAVGLDPRLARENDYALLVAFHRGDLRGATANLEQTLADVNTPPFRRNYLIMRGHGGPCLALLYIEAGLYAKMREASKEYYTPRQISGWGQTRHFVAMERWSEIIDAHRIYSDLAKADTTLGPFYPRDLGKALAELGDAGGAREIAKQLLEAEFEAGAMVVHDANDIRARAALAERDPKTALKFLSEMRKNGVPWGGYIDIDYRTTLARAYRMDGRLNEAAEVHREMLRIYGSHAISHYELGTLYEEMKRPAEAKKEYAKFLEMWSEADEDLPQLVDAKKRFAAL